MLILIAISSICILYHILDTFLKHLPQPWMKPSFSLAVKNPRSAIDIRNRPRIPIPDEDPYSIAGSGSSGSSGNGNRERSVDTIPKRKK